MSSSQTIPDSWIIDEDLKLTCEACPTQLEGNYRGHRVYFRLRHGSWRLEVDGKIIARGSAKDNDPLITWDDWDGMIEESDARAIVEREINKLEGE